MLIIGSRFHSRFQQIAMVDTETGEVVERRLDHSNGEAEKFYAELKKPVRVGMEATGYAQWFERLLAELGQELWVGDAAEIRAAMVRKQKTEKGDALGIFVTYCWRTGSRGSGFRHRQSATYDSCCGIATRWFACELRASDEANRW
jgi:hypothetical protein